MIRNIEIKYVNVVENTPDKWMKIDWVGRDGPISDCDEGLKHRMDIFF